MLTDDRKLLANKFIQSCIAHDLASRCQGDLGGLFISLGIVGAHHLHGDGFSFGIVGGQGPNTGNLFTTTCIGRGRNNSGSDNSSSASENEDKDAYHEDDFETHSDGSSSSDEE